MNIFSIFTFLVLSLSVAHCAESASILSSEDVRLNDLAGKEYDCAKEIQEMSQSERIHLYTYFRNNLDSPQWRSLSKLVSSRVLFALGEPQARKEKLEKFRDDPYSVGENLYWLGDPTLIEALAPYLLSNDPNAPLDDGSDIKPIERPYRSLIAMRETIINSNVFQPEVVAWAKRNSFPHTADAEGLEIFRRWWRENAGFFAKKDYKSVKPGPDFVFNLLRSEKPPANPPEPAPVAATPPPQSSATAREPAGESSSFLAGFITALCATFLGLGYWISSRRNPPAAK